MEWLRAWKSFQVAWRPRLAPCVLPAVLRRKLKATLDDSPINVEKNVEKLLAYTKVVIAMMENIYDLSINYSDGHASTINDFEEVYKPLIFYETRQRLHHSARPPCWLLLNDELTDQQLNIRCRWTVIAGTGWRFRILENWKYTLQTSY